MTMLEATQKWVSEFNAIPMNMIATLMNYDPDSWHEVTEKWLPLYKARGLKWHNYATEI